MTTRFTVHDISTDDKTNSRRCTVKVGTSGDIKIKTPIRRGVEGATDVPVYEPYRKVKPAVIENCMESEQYDRRVGKGLNDRCKGQFNILTMEYDSKDVIPSDMMIEALSDMQYLHTDAITTPSWFNLITRKNSTNTALFMELSRKYVDCSSIRNHKPIIGAIPQSIPPNRLSDVVKLYVDKDVTSFVIDSHGRTLISGMWVRTLERAINEYNIENEGILYSINSFQGTVRKNEMNVEAKDFIGFAAGMDFIGWKHTSNYFGSDNNEDITIARRFDPESYNYIRVRCDTEEKNRITAESIRSQNKELENVRDAIYDQKLMELLSEKKISKETIHEISSCKNNVRSSLDDFFI